MPSGPHPDVTASLTDLERKLVELERELGSVSSSPGVAPPPLPSPPEPGAAAEGADAPDDPRVDDLRGEIAELVRFRDQLEGAARDLVAEYDRLVGRLQSVETPAAPQAPPAPAPYAPPPIPVPAHPSALGPPAAAPAPAPEQAYAPPPQAYAPPPQAYAPAAPPVPAGLPHQPIAQAAPEPPPAPAAPAVSPFDSMTFQGPLVVDAGPFAEITTLTAFEQGLATVPGASDVYVRSFEGSRALIDLRLAHPVALVQSLRERLGLPITAREATAGRLVVDVVTGDPRA